MPLIRDCTTGPEACKALVAIHERNGRAARIKLKHQLAARTRDTGGSGPIVCYRCLRPGHVARDCDGEHVVRDSATPSSGDTPPPPHASRCDRERCSARGRGPAHVWKPGKARSRARLDSGLAAGIPALVGFEWARQVRAESRRVGLRRACEFVFVVCVLCYPPGQWAPLSCACSVFCVLCFVFRRVLCFALLCVSCSRSSPSGRVVMIWRSGLYGLDARARGDLYS